MIVDGGAARGSFLPSSSIEISPFVVGLLFFFCARARERFEANDPRDTGVRTVKMTGEIFPTATVPVRTYRNERETAG